MPKTAAPRFTKTWRKRVRKVLFDCVVEFFLFLLRNSNCTFVRCPLLPFIFSPECFPAHLREYSSVPKACPQSLTAPHSLTSVLGSTVCWRTAEGHEVGDREWARLVNSFHTALVPDSFSYQRCSFLLSRVTSSFYFQSSTVVRFSRNPLGLPWWSSG